MSDSTPVCTTKDIVTGFEIQDHSAPKSGLNSENGHISDFNQKETIPTYQDFKDNLAEETNVAVEQSAKKYESAYRSAQRSSPKKGGKHKAKPDLLVSYSPLKPKQTPSKPVLSRAKTHAPKSPLISGAKKSKLASTTKKSKPKLHHGFSSDVPQQMAATHRRLRTDIQDGFMSTGNKASSIGHSPVSYHGLAQEVEENKKEIDSKKQRLVDLESEIYEMSDKMNKYQTETAEITEQLKQRITQRETEHEMIKNQPLLYFNDADLNEDEVNPNPDELLFKVRYGIDKKFKNFIDNTRPDVRMWKEACSDEMKQFSKFLENKHREMVQKFTQEISEFTPVLSHRFEE